MASAWFTAQVAGMGFLRLISLVQTHLEHQIQLAMTVLLVIIANQWALEELDIVVACVPITMFAKVASNETNQAVKEG